jgi:signal transduction histidine kinase
MIAPTRRRVLSAAAALAVIGGVTLFNRLVVRSGPPADVPLIASAAIALAVVAVIGAEWPRSSTRIVALSAAAALASLAATAAHAPREAPQDAFWVVTEVIALLALLVMVARWATVRDAVIAGGLTGAAAMSTMWRVTVWSSPPALPEVLGALLNWSFGVALAAALGVYLRTLDARRSRSVVEARRAQRMEIARDLHDFVAHDVTGMVVQAQAAHLVAERDPKEALAALGRIEDAGLRALGSLDHTVRMLGDLAVPTKGSTSVADERSAADVASRRFSLEDVLALVGRFAATDPRPVRLHVDTSGEPRIAPEVASIAYRVVLEGLTNVRRHAPAGARVDVSIVPGEDGSAPALAVRIASEAAMQGEAATMAPLRSDARSGGRGLAQLEELVGDVGGFFAAGPVDGVGGRSWHVTAVLPQRGSARS